MTTQIETSQYGRISNVVRGRLLLVSPLAMSTSIAANLGLYAIVGYLFPHVASWPGTSPIHIIIATIVYLLFATFIFATVRRFLPRPALYYLIIATLSLLFSMWPPTMLGFGPGLPGVPPADAVIAITLGLMHIISYAISVPMFIRMALD